MTERKMVAGLTHAEREAHAPVVVEPDEERWDDPDRPHWVRREPQPVDTTTLEPWPEPTEEEAVAAWSQVMEAMTDAAKQMPPGDIARRRKTGPPIKVMRQGKRTTSWRVDCRECEKVEVDGLTSWPNKHKAHQAAVDHAREVHQWAARIVTDEEGAG